MEDDILKHSYQSGAPIYGLDNSDVVGVNVTATTSSGSATAFTSDIENRVVSLNKEEQVSDLLNEDLFLVTSFTDDSASNSEYQLTFEYAITKEGVDEFVDSIDFELVGTKSAPKQDSFTLTAESGQLTKGNHNVGGVRIRSMKNYSLKATAHLKDNFIFDDGSSSIELATKYAHFTLPKPPAGFWQS